MGSLIALALLLAAGLAPSTVAAAAPTLAVTYFDNNTTEDRFDPLGRGLADMLITDLAGLEGLAVVERGRLNDILSELELQTSSFVDPVSAVQVGKGLGAEYVLTGAFLAVAPDMRIDARIVNVSTGKVVQAEAVQGPVDEFFLLEKELATLIIDQLKVSVSARESARMGRPATESFDAFVAWSAGLEALDRGALQEARDQLAAALEHDDRFALADAELEGLQERLRQLTTQGQEARSAYARDLLRRIDKLEASGGPWDELATDMLEVQTRLSAISTSRDALQLSSRLMDLGLPEELKLGGQHGVAGVNEWAVCRYTEASYYLGMRAEVITYGEACLERYPTSYLAGEPRRLMGVVLELIRKERAGKKRIPQIQAAARAFARGQICILEREPQARLDACRVWVEGAQKDGLAWESDDARNDAYESWGTAAARAGDREALGKVIDEARSWKPHCEAVSELQDEQQDLEEAWREAESQLASVRSSDKDGDWYRAAWALSDAGRHDEARRIIEEGIQRFPASGKLHRYATSTAIDLGDLPRAEAAMERWEASGASVESDIIRKLEEARPLVAMAAWAPGWEQFQLGVGYGEVSQHVLAGEAWLRLSRDHPDFEPNDPALSVFHAATQFDLALQPERARATFEELVERFPDSEYVSVARVKLEYLP